MKKIARYMKYPKIAGRAIPVLIVVVAIASAFSYLAYSHYGKAEAQVPPPSGSTADEIASRLMCLCGCNSVLFSCPDQPTCPFWVSATTLIRTQLAQGKTSDQIMDGFVETYGVRVLVETPKSGFSLVAWIAPFAGLVAGAILLFGLLRNWTSRGKATVGPLSSPSPNAEASVDDEYRRRVEKELKEME